MKVICICNGGRVVLVWMIDGISVQNIVDEAFAQT